jgi:hypothetical protein
MPKTPINPRKKKLDAISSKIAMFLVSETYTTEQPAQKLLSEAIQKLDEAAALLVKSDAEHGDAPAQP